MTKSILIVEDEAIVAMEIQNTLERLGYTITAFVSSGTKAISIALEYKPDLILMDIQIKGDMDGIEAAEQIRSCSFIPIIFLTAYAEESTLKRAKLTLPFGYLLKPFQERDLQVTIEMALYAAKIEADRREALDALQKMHDELDNKVKERTIELEKAKDKAVTASKVKSEFLNMVSHELRSPLHQILSYSKFGIKKTGHIPNENIIDFFKNIEKSGGNLLNLLNDLLDLSKLRSSKTEYTMTENRLEDIVQMIINEHRIIIEERKLTVELVKPEVPTNLQCDVNKVSQVIRNLLFNAIKFAPLETRITFQLDFEPLPDGLRVNDISMVPALRLTVKDEGMGIPPDELEKVFGKFMQSSKTKSEYAGTGLGLAICKEIIQAHKGKIWAENNPEVGSAFRFVLPLQQKRRTNQL